jgi:hypothetical protein
VKRSIPRLASLLIVVAACGPSGPEAAPPLPPDSFAFGVFGDGPYDRREDKPFARVVDDVNDTELAWLIHVGDILGGSCSDGVYRDRLRKINRIRHPVVYTPGDNEWTDCRGRHEPLERLATLRRTFFAHPARSLGGRPMVLQSQSADPAYREFVENARWTRGGFVFATLHVVGSANGSRTGDATNDAEAARRMAAAIAWMDAAFADAHARNARGVVLVVHADMGLEGGDRTRGAYVPLIDRMKEQVDRFPGPVVLIHGDSHEYRVDHPLRNARGRRYRNFTRVETFGSPDIGWVRVVVDTAAGRVVDVQPRQW